jgi:hypothetical protein
VKPPGRAGAAPEAAPAPGGGSGGVPPRTSPTTSITNSPAVQPADELTALEAEGQKLDAQMQQTAQRSKSPEAAEMLLGPLRAARAEVDNRIRLAQQARGTASRPAPPPPNASADLAEVDRRLAEVKQRGSGYEGTIQELEAKRNALIEQQNQARRTGGVQSASPAAPGLRMGPR